MLGMFVEHVVLLTSESSLQYSEETEYYKVVSVSDTNGSLSTFYRHDIREFGLGHFNLTLPLSGSQILIELNSSIFQVVAEWMFHLELPGDNEDLIEGAFASDIEMSVGTETFVDHGPICPFIIGSACATSVTSKLVMSVKGDTLRSLNASYLNVRCESLVEASCDAFYTANYVISFTVNIEYARPTRVPGPYLILSPSLMILGLSSALLVLEEVERRPEPV